MASSIKLKNANGKTVSITNSNANQTDKEVIYLNTVDELSNASSSINAVAIVSDLDRGGTFIWSATGTANGGTVFAGSTGYWIRQYDGAVNVKWFGAKGDGITDDTLAIQASIDANVGSLLIPPGTYVVAGLVFPEYVIIKGYGATLKKKPYTAGNMITGSAHGSTWRIEGLTLDADQANQTPEQLAYTVLAMGIVGIYDFHHCIFLGQEFASIRVDGDAVIGNHSKVNISNCRFLGGQEGTEGFAPRYVSLGGAIQAVVSGNNFDLQAKPVASGICGIATVLIGDPNSVALVISDNFFTDVGRCAVNRLGAIEAYAGAGGVIVKGNRIVRAYGRGISTKANIKSCVVVGNIVDGTVSDGVNYAHGITMSGTAGDTTIGSGFVCSNNVVQDAAGIGFNLIGDTLAPGYLSEVSIASNVCRNSVVNNFNIQGFKNVVFTGNLSYNSGDISVKTSDLTGEFVFTSNLIDTSLTQSGLTVFDDNFTTLNLIAVGNTFKNLPLYGIVASASALIGIAGFTISNNRFENITMSCIRFGGQTKASTIRGNTFVNCSLPFSSFAESTFIDAADNFVTSGIAPAVTITEGAVTVWNQVHVVATEGGAATDDLDTIKGGYTGRVVTLVAVSNSNDVVLKDGTGNLRLNGNFTLTHSEDTITLMYVNGTWRELCRSDNAI